jgi:hypothetical protein
MFAAFPFPQLPATAPPQFENAAPCPKCGTGQNSLWPVQSAQLEGVYAVMCKYGHIGGDGRNIADAITTWNNEARATVS